MINSTSLIKLNRRFSRLYVTSFAGTALLLFLAIGIEKAHAQTALDGEQRYQLCSRFPHNSQCKGYTVPVALKNRSGLESKCDGDSPQGRQEGDCKIVFYQDSLIVYIEQGESLSVLDNHRATSEVKIPYSQMQTLSYREFVDKQYGKKVAYALLVGGPAAAVPDKPMAEVAVQYQAASETGEIIAGTTGQLSFTLERDKGFSVRSQIESQTNLRVDVPTGELPFIDVPTP